MRVDKHGSKLRVIRDGFLVVELTRREALLTARDRTVDERVREALTEVL